MDQVLTSGPGLDDGEPLKINSAYSNLGITRGWEPTPVQQLRIWLSGYSGHGTTSFVMSNPHAIVLDMEHMAHDVPYPLAAHTHRRNYTEYGQYLSLLDKLISDGPSKSGFQHVVIDTIGRFISVMDPHLAKRFGRESMEELGQSQYKYIVDEVISHLYGLEEAGYGYTIVDHFKEEVDYEANTIRWRPTSTPSLRSVLRRETQLIGTLEMSWKRVNVSPNNATPPPVIRHNARGTDRQSKKNSPKEPKRTPKISAPRLVPRVYLRFLELEEQAEGIETKGRYVAEMPEQKILLPQNGGWAKFAQVYNQAVETTRAKLLKS